MSDWKKIIQDAKELLDIGAITQEQFEQIRNDALANRSESTTPPPNLNDMRTRIHTGGFTPTAPASGLDTMGTMVGKMDGDVVASYKIIELIGEGGMGSVYRGRHTIEAFGEAEGDVAIKMILPSLAKDEAFKNRFIREASLGKKLNHPNIAKVVSIHSSDDVLALVMEYIDGHDLKAMLSIQPEGMTYDWVLALLKPIASALDYLHSEGIVHRDLKPTNIRIDHSESPIILDFGIAKDVNDVDANMTQTGTAMGTQTYMAPEQMDAKRVTGAADQYALAMMAYQMLSGRLPWDEGISSARLSVIKLTGELKSIDSYIKVSDGLNAVITKGLSLKPEDRFDSCGEFIQHLEQCDGNIQRNIEYEIDTGFGETDELQIVHRQHRRNPITHNQSVVAQETKDREVQSFAPQVTVQERNEESVDQLNNETKVVQQAIKGRVLLGVVGLCICLWMIVSETESRDKGSEQSVSTSTESISDNSAVSSTKTSTSDEATSIVVPLGDFSVPLKGNDPMLLVSMSIEGPKKIEATLSTHQAEIRKAIVMRLSEYTAESLQGLEGKMDLRDEIMTLVNSIIKPLSGERIYFTKFILVPIVNAKDIVEDDMWRELRETAERSEQFSKELEQWKNGKVSTTSAAESPKQIEEGKRALDEQRWSEAIQLFKFAYQTNPDPELLTSIGFAQFKSGQHSLAKGSLLKAAEEGSFSAYKWLGYLLRTQGDIAGSNHFFNQYLQSNPVDAVDIRQEMMR